MVLHSLSLWVEETCPDLPVFLLPFLWFAISASAPVIGIKSPTEVAFVVCGHVMLCGWAQGPPPFLAWIIPLLSRHFQEHKYGPTHPAPSTEKRVKYYLVVYSSRIHFRCEWMPSHCYVKSTLQGLARNQPFIAKFSFTLFMGNVHKCYYPSLGNLQLSC